MCLIITKRSKGRRLVIWIDLTIQMEIFFIIWVGGMMMDSEGHMMQDMGSGLAMDMESGELHFTDSGSHSLFDEDEDEDEW